MAFVKVRSLQDSTIKVVGDEKKLTILVPAAILEEGNFKIDQPVSIEIDTRARQLAILGSTSEAHWPLKRKNEKTFELAIQELPGKKREELSSARFKVSPSKLIVNLPEKWELADDMALKA